MPVQFILDGTNEHRVYLAYPPELECPYPFHMIHDPGMDLLVAHPIPFHMMPPNQPVVHQPQLMQPATPAKVNQPMYPITPSSGSSLSLKRKTFAGSETSGISQGQSGPE